MFVGSYYPTAYFPTSYFPKTGAASAVGALGVGGRRLLNRTLISGIDAARRERQRMVARRMSYRTFVEAVERMVVHSEIRRRQQVLTAAAYSTILAEI